MKYLIISVALLLLTVVGIAIARKRPSTKGTVTNLYSIYLKDLCDKKIAGVCYRETDGHGNFKNEPNGGMHCDLLEGNTCYDASDSNGNHVELSKDQQKAVAKELGYSPSE